MNKKTSLKLSIFIAVFLLSSCAGKHKQEETKIEETEQTQIEEKIDNQIVPEQTFETIENEDQASAISEKENSEIEVQDRVFFAYDSSEISDEAKKILDVQSLWLKSDESIKIIIEGHCDEKGTREYNIALGEKRANAAKQYLTKSGIASSRIKTISYGKEKLAYFGADEEVISKNRRAVVVVE
jgi:peptidoglycan-associated lipoprotein